MCSSAVQWCAEEDFAVPERINQWIITFAAAVVPPPRNNARAVCPGHILVTLWSHPGHTLVLERIRSHTRRRQNHGDTPGGHSMTLRNSAEVWSQSGHPIRVVLPGRRSWEGVGEGGGHPFRGHPSGSGMQTAGKRGWFYEKLFLSFQLWLGNETGEKSNATFSAHSR